jgi:hypothetical protein
LRYAEPSDWHPANSFVIAPRGKSGELVRPW